MKIEVFDFGTLQEKEIMLFVLENSRGIRVSLTNYGGIVTSIVMPDRKGRPANIVCGFENFEDYRSCAYLERCPYFGALIGRVANRIAQGRFTLEGREYFLSRNAGDHSLHGGTVGFDKRVWAFELFDEAARVGVELSYLSPHMEEGYPGNLGVTCRYSLDEENRLELSYTASTDRATLVNLTNHSYFNLSGKDEPIGGHGLKLRARYYTESSDLIPTGRILPVEGTLYDFQSSRTLRKGVENLPQGYDLHYVLEEPGNLAVPAAVLEHAPSGRRVELYTSQPGLQLYTGHAIPEITLSGKGCFGPYSGVALEPQYYPDGIHHETFPSTVLLPGEIYREATVYAFTTFS